MHRDLHAGYVLDIPYPETFFRELSPAWLNYVAAVCGAPTRELERSFTYLELAGGRAAYGRHVIEPSGRQLAEECLGVGNIEHVAGVQISVHAGPIQSLRGQSIRGTEKEPRGREKARTGRASQVRMTVVVPRASRKRRLPG